MRAKQMRLTSWGRHRHVDMTAFRPERLADLQQAVRDSTEAGGIIAYGDGRNYGDLAMRDGGTALLLRRLDRFLDFDPITGQVTVEPGVTFSELFAFSVEHGFLPPVVPGTAFVTLGGGIASDVHGKNHDRHGSFGHHIEWLDIVTADGECVRASPKERPELFAATIGGCGLTGVIARLRLRLRRKRANAVETDEYRVRDLDHFFELMTSYREKATYTVGWVDALQKGRSLGRGIFQTGEPINVEAIKPPGNGLSVPFTMPKHLLNRFSIGVFNALYYRRVPFVGRQRIIEYSAFHHPLDAIGSWNRLYGHSGFYQFQCVLPDETSRDGIRDLLEQVAKAGAASFLGVLKTFGTEGSGYLSFPRRGVTLSLDLPARSETIALLSRLEATTLDNGGRIYLAKDSTLSAKGFAEMYPSLNQFRSVLNKYDPKGRFESEMSRRLQIKATS